MTVEAPCQTHQGYSDSSQDEDCYPGDSCEEGIPPDNDQDWDCKSRWATKAKKKSKHCSSKSEEHVDAYESDEVAASISKNDLLSRLQMRTAGSAQEDGQLQAHAHEKNNNDKKISLTIRIPCRQLRDEKPVGPVVYKQKQRGPPPLSCSVVNVWMK